jgi:GNAT superfamily N-acetyltransferase
MTAHEPAHPITYLEAGERIKEGIARDWSETVARHLHFSGGFTFLAVSRNVLAGVISVFWDELPPPLTGTLEGYIDIIEVRPGYRRRGIAARLVELAARRAREEGAYQLRAWSSEDKLEALYMWRRLLGFGLCPAATYPHGEEVRGYFVTRVLEQRPGEAFKGRLDSE